MDRKTNPQLSLFPDESPDWKAMPQECQHDLEEALSQLIELALQWPSLQHVQPQNQNSENQHV